MLSDWEGLKTEVKRGCGIATGVFIEKHRRRNGQFFLSILVAHGLSILQGYPLRLRATVCSLIIHELS